MYGGYVWIVDVMRNMCGCCADLCLCYVEHVCVCVWNKCGTCVEHVWMLCELCGCCVEVVCNMCGCYVSCV